MSKREEDRRKQIKAALRSHDPFSHHEIQDAIDYAVESAIITNTMRGRPGHPGVPGEMYKKFPDKVKSVLRELTSKEWMRRI